MTHTARRFLIAPVDSAARWGWSQVIDADPVEDCPLCGWPLVPGDPEYRVCRCEIGELLLRGAS